MNFKEELEIEKEKIKNPTKPSLENFKIAQMIMTEETLKKVKESLKYQFNNDKNANRIETSIEPRGVNLMFVKGLCESGLLDVNYLMELCAQDGIELIIIDDEDFYPSFYFVIDFTKKAEKVKQ